MSMGFNVSSVELTHEELQLVRACISVAKDSVAEGELLATTREIALINDSDTDKLYSKFLG